MSQKKKRFHFSKSFHEPMQEPSTDRGMKLIWKKKDQVVSEPGPNPWRLAGLLSEFVVYKIALNQEEYKQSQENRDAPNLASITFRKDNAFVVVNLFSRGDGGFSCSTCGFEVMIEGNRVFCSTSDRNPFLRPVHPNVNYSRFVQEIGGWDIDEPFLKKVFCFVLPHWMKMVDRICGDLLAGSEQSTEKEGNLDQIGAFGVVFIKCVKRVIEYCVSVPSE